MPAALTSAQSERLIHCSHFKKVTLRYIRSNCLQRSPGYCQLHLNVLILISYFPSFIKDTLLTVYSLHRYMFDSMGKTEVVEYSSCFQRPCTNWRKPTLVTIPTFQWLVTIKCYFLPFQGDRIQRIYFRGDQERVSSPPRTLPSSRSWLVGWGWGKNHLREVPKGQVGGVPLLNAAISLANFQAQGHSSLERGDREEARNVCWSPKSRRDYTGFYFCYQLLDHWELREENVHFSRMSSRKGFNIGNQRLTKSLEEQIAPRSKKSLLMFRKSERRIIRKPQLMTPLSIALKWVVSRKCWQNHHIASGPLLKPHALLPPLEHWYPLLFPTRQISHTGLWFSDLQLKPGGKGHPGNTAFRPSAPAIEENPKGFEDGFKMTTDNPAWGGAF